MRAYSLPPQKDRDKVIPESELMGIDALAHNEVIKEDLKEQLRAEIKSRAGTMYVDAESNQRFYEKIDEFERRGGAII